MAQKPDDAAIQRALERTAAILEGTEDDSEPDGAEEADALPPAAEDRSGSVEAPGEPGDASGTGIDGDGEGPESSEEGDSLPEAAPSPSVSMSSLSASSSSDSGNDSSSDSSPPARSRPKSAVKRKAAPKPKAKVKPKAAAKRQPKTTPQKKAATAKPKLIYEEAKALPSSASTSAPLGIKGFDWSDPADFRSGKKAKRS